VQASSKIAAEVIIAQQRIAARLIDMLSVNRIQQN
jgi:hypothetical protein